MLKCEAHRQSHCVSFFLSLSLTLFSLFGLFVAGLISCFDGTLCVESYSPDDHFGPLFNSFQCLYNEEELASDLNSMFQIVGYFLWSDSVD